DGAGGRGAPTSLPPASPGVSPQDVAVADLNLDGKPDLVTLEYSSGTFRVWLGDGTGAFALSGSFPAAPLPQGIALADLNLDGRPDAVVPSDNHLLLLQ